MNFSIVNRKTRRNYLVKSEVILFKNGEYIDLPSNEIGLLHKNNLCQIYFFLEQCLTSE